MANSRPRERSLPRPKLTTPASLVVGLALATSPGCSKSADRHDARRQGVPGGVPAGPASAGPSSTPDPQARTMQASAVKLRGRVIDPRGGVAEIRTYVGSQALEGPEVRTDPSGAFELTLPDAAVVLVEASAADGRAATMRVLPVAGRIDVVAELPPNADEPETTSPIKLANVDSPAERVAQVVATYDTLRGQASPEHLVELAEMIEAETDGNVRQVLLVAYASLAFAPDETELREARLAAVDPAMVARLFAEVPATGFAWSLEWEALTLLDTTGHEPFVQKVAREHPDPDVRAALLAFMARSALEAGERDEARAMLSLANRTAPDSIFTAAVREAYPDLASSPASAAE